MEEILWLQWCVPAVRVIRKPMQRRWLSAISIQDSKNFFCHIKDRRAWRKTESTDAFRWRTGIFIWRAADVWSLITIHSCRMKKHLREYCFCLSADRRGSYSSGNGAGRLKSSSRRVSTVLQNHRWAASEAEDMSAKKIHLPQFGTNRKLVQERT